MCIDVCSQELLKHVEESEHTSAAAESQQQHSTDNTTSVTHDTVSTVQSTSNQVAVDPKYVQLLGDKTTVSLNILVFPVITIRCKLLMYMFELPKHRPENLFCCIF